MIKYISNNDCAMLIKYYIIDAIYKILILQRYEIGAAFGRLMGESMSVWFPDGIGGEHIVPGGLYLSSTRCLRLPPPFLSQHPPLLHHHHHHPILHISVHLSLLFYFLSGTPFLLFTSLTHP